MLNNSEFEEGDRVTRPENIFDNKSQLRHGTVIKKYSKNSGYNGVQWHEPEVYDIHWDNGHTEKGYCGCHGLDKEKL